MLSIYTVRRNAKEMDNTIRSIRMDIGKLMPVPRRNQTFLRLSFFLNSRPTPWGLNQSHPPPKRKEPPHYVELASLRLVGMSDFRG